MESFSKSRRKIALLIIGASALTVGLSGIVNAQSSNPEIKSAKEPVPSGNKPVDKNNSAIKGKTPEKKRPKQDSGRDAQNYKGAQPPQGGRRGQGPE